MTATLIRPGLPLRERYSPDAVHLLPASMRGRLAAGGDAAALAWDLLYRLEPQLYDRLIAGERIHPRILDWLPKGIERAVEVGAGTGRLTLELASRCRALVAFEPIGPMRERLVARLEKTGVINVDVCAADVCALPMRDSSVDAVLTCAVLTPQPVCGGELGLAEVERICRPGGLVALVWPHTPRWLERHGYRREVFAGDMFHEFTSAEEAAELTRIFYPDRVDDVLRLGSACVPYEVLGINAPRDVAWKVVA